MKPHPRPDGPSGIEKEVSAGLVVLGMLGAALLLAFDAIFVNLSFLSPFN